MYTPQVVVDGRAETVGSNRSNVDNLIRIAAAQKIGIDVAHHKDGTADIVRSFRRIGTWTSADL